MRGLSVLNDPTSQIRLLRICSATEHGSLVATQQTFAIATAPSYAAVSYTWGPEQPVAPVTINAIEISVRQNCRYALWQSFLHNSELLIWIDSICIDQDNSHEKSGQVGMMGDIFRQAQLVFTSIGSHQHDSAFMCGAIAHFEVRLAGPRWDVVDAGKPRSWHTKRVPKHWLPWKSTEPWMEWWLRHLSDFKNVSPEQMIRKLPPEQLITMTWAGYLKSFGHLTRLRTAAECLIKRPYWTRLWVLQEVSLAQIVFIMCGPDLVLWSSLESFLQTLNYWPHDKYQLKYEMFHTVDNFGYGTPKRELTDPSLFDRFLEMNCSDVRDRIFGTLNLVVWCDGEGAAFPNYNMTTKGIAAEVLATYCRHLRRDRTNGDTPRNCIRLVGELSKLLGLTYRDLVVHSHDMLQRLPAVTPSLNGSSHLIRLMGNNSPPQQSHIKTWLHLPNFCELMPGQDDFTLTMDETYGVFRTQILDVFREVMEQELLLFSSEPRFRRLVVNGQTAGLLCLQTEPGDVLETIDVHGSRRDRKPNLDIDLCLIFRPIRNKQLYAVVGHAIVGKGLPPLYHPYKSDDALAFSREGTFYLSPYDIFTQAARENVLHKQRSSNTHSAIAEYLAGSFTTSLHSSAFISYPDQERYLDRSRKVAWR